MNNYRMGTKCVQAGYKPGNGEPRQIPIIQSTTFKYDTSEDMGKLFDLEAEGYFYLRPCCSQDCCNGGWNCSYAHFFRTGSQFHGSVQYL